MYILLLQSQPDYFIVINNVEIFKGTAQTLRRKNGLHLHQLITNKRWWFPV